MAKTTTPPCDHTEPGSWCSLHRLTEEDRQPFERQVKRMRPMERTRYLGTCRVVKPVPDDRTKFTVDYYLGGDRRWPVCKQAFMHFYHRRSSVIINRENRSLYELGEIRDRRLEHRPERNQYGTPITEQDWRLLEQWIITAIPRKMLLRPVGEVVSGGGGGDGYVIFDKRGDAIGHLDMLKQYNEENQRQFTIANWKKCWYQRMKLKGVWEPSSKYGYRSVVDREGE